MSTKIQWTDETWNPVTGCTPCASGCVNCYARTMHRRLMAMSGPKYQHDFGKVRCHTEEMDKPARWRKPRRVFVNSMSDTFHPDVPDGFIFWMWHQMCLSRCTFMLLTKRPDRMRAWFAPSWIVLPLWAEGS